MWNRSVTVLLENLAEYILLGIVTNHDRMQTKFLYMKHAGALHYSKMLTKTCVCNMSQNEHLIEGK